MPKWCFVQLGRKSEHGTSTYTWKAVLPPLWPAGGPINCPPTLTAATETVPSKLLAALLHEPGSFPYQKLAHRTKDSSKLPTKYLLFITQIGQVDSIFNIHPPLHGPDRVLPSFDSTIFSPPQLPPDWRSPSQVFIRSTHFISIIYLEPQLCSFGAARTSSKSTSATLLPLKHVTLALEDLDVPSSSGSGKALKSLKGLV